MFYEFKETKTYRPNNLPLVNLSEVYSSQGRYELKPGDFLLDGEDEYLLCLANHCKAVLYSLKTGYPKSDYVPIERLDSISEREINELTDHNPGRFSVQEPNGKVRSLVEYLSQETPYSPVQVGERLYSINGVERYIVGGMLNETGLISEYTKFIMDATTGEVLNSVGDYSDNVTRSLTERELSSLGINLKDFYILRSSSDEIKI